MISLTHNTSSQIGQVVLTSADEVDVTAITIQNGQFASGGANKGGVTMNIGGFRYPFSFERYENSHYTFPTPIPLRHGDFIDILIPGGNTSGHTTICMFGTPPAIVSDEIAVY